MTRGPKMECGVTVPLWFAARPLLVLMTKESGFAAMESGADTPQSKGETWLTITFLRLRR